MTEQRDRGWVPAFEGQRPPFEPGHDLSVRHGAYATLQLGPRVDELAGEIRGLVPGYRPTDEIAVRLLALSLARIEKAAGALEDAAVGELARLDQDLRGWVNSAARQADKLAMTNTARARLGLDVAQTRRAMSLTEMAAAAEEEQRGELEGAS